MAWYRVGTVSVTNGSPNVTLTGGNALANISPGDGFMGPDGRTYEVSLIGGAGAFTLATNYAGVTASGQIYQIIPVADYVQLRDALTQINTLITDYQTIALNAGTGKFAVGSAAAPGVRGIGQEGTGLVWNGDGTLSISVGGTIAATFSTAGSSAITFADGTVGAPGIRFGADTNTGIYRPSADAMDFVTAGASRMRVANDKISIGLGSGVSLDVLGTVKSGASNITTGLTGFVLPYNTGYGGVFGSLRSTGDIITSKYTRPSSSVGNGWESAVAESAGRAATILSNTSFAVAFGPTTTTPIGDPVTLTNAFSVDSSGQMLVTGGPAGATQLRLTSSATQPNVAFYNSDSNANNRNWVIVAGHTDYGDLVFRSSNAQAGNPLTAGANMFRLLRDGQAQFVNGNGAAPSISFINDPNTGIYASGTDVLLFALGGATRYSFDTLGINPNVDNTYRLGWSGGRWTVIYAATGTINTSDENQKFDIGEIPDEWLDAWADVQWSRYKFVGGHRWHVGLIAQRVYAAFAAHGIDAFEIGLCCYDKWDAIEAVEAVEAVEPQEEIRDDEGNVIQEAIEGVEGVEGVEAQEAGETWGLRYDECFAMEAAYQRRVQTQQEERIAALEALLNV